MELNTPEVARALDSIYSEFDPRFRGIPVNPEHWSSDHLRECIRWITTNIDFSEFGYVDSESILQNYDGKKLLNTSYDDIIKMTPPYFGHILFDMVDFLMRTKDQYKNKSLELWQFILDILHDDTRADIVSFIKPYTDDYKFIIRNTEELSRLWGVYKSYPNMDYAKLSRALRYYYDPKQKSPMKMLKWKREHGYSFIHLRNIPMPMVRYDNSVFFDRCY